MIFAQSTKFAAWILVGLNLLMALGAIWIFMRMAPAIEIIIDRNARSLEASEEMLTALALTSVGDLTTQDLRVSFAEALQRAQNNITEEGEPVTLARIQENYDNAFLGEAAARKQTIAAILKLSDINRSAMETADRRARQLGSAGAWGIVFMATIVFFSGMIFIRRITTSLIQPLEEIHAVIIAHRNGDRMRRCNAANYSRDIKVIFEDMNGFLDRQAFETETGVKKG